MSFDQVSIETVKEYWNRQPCNIRHSAAPFGTKKYFDEIERRKYFVEPHIPRFAQFERWRGLKVLEIGCGIGTDTISFARAGAHVTAIDVSAKSLEVARLRARVYGLEDRIEFYEGDAENLSKFLPSKSYDLIYSFGVIHHTPDPQRVIQEIQRNFAASGTILKIMLYHRHSWKVFQILSARDQKKGSHKDEQIAYHSEAQQGCPVTYTFSRKQAASLLAPRFKITEMRIEHIFPYEISEYKEYRYKKLWYIKLLPSRFFNLLARIWGWHLCITARFD